MLQQEKEQEAWGVQMVFWVLETSWWNRPKWYSADGSWTTNILSAVRFESKPDIGSYIWRPRCVDWFAEA